MDGEPSRPGARIGPVSANLARPENLARAWCGCAEETRSQALPSITSIHKHSAVGQKLSPSLRGLLATFCVALSFLFAGVSAAAVVDGAQHAAQSTHEHGLYVGLAADSDHDPVDHHQEGDDEDRDAAPSDGQPGPGHQHSDAPAGALSSFVDAGPAQHGAGLTLLSHGAPSAEGVRPGGLKRPPRGLAILS